MATSIAIRVSPFAVVAIELRPLSRKSPFFARENCERPYADDEDDDDDDNSNNNTTTTITRKTRAKMRGAYDGGIASFLALALLCLFHTSCFVDGM